eukprot:scaffold274714_cov21-Tisochrysis_lutea.AAC.1
MTERQKETCTPSRRCMPEQSRHISVPKVTEAQVGFLAGQSKQVWRRGRDREGDSECVKEMGANQATRETRGVSVVACHTRAFPLSPLFLLASLLSLCVLAGWLTLSLARFLSSAKISSLMCGGTSASGSGRPWPE